MIGNLHGKWTNDGQAFIYGSFINTWFSWIFMHPLNIRKGRQPVEFFTRQSLRITLVTKFQTKKTAQDKSKEVIELMQLFLTLSGDLLC